MCQLLLCTLFFDYYGVGQLNQGRSEGFREDQDDEIQRKKALEPILQSSEDISE